MMTPAPVASAADAASYYSSKDNYYFLDDMPTQWLGEGAPECESGNSNSGTAGAGICQGAGGTHRQT